MLSREHEGRERDTEGVGEDVSMPVKLFFGFQKSVFREVRIDYNLDLSFLVKKQFSMIMEDLSSVCNRFLLAGYAKNYNLYLLALPLRVDYGWPFVNDAKFKKYIYSHSKKYICTQGIILHPATMYLCSLKELNLFNFKEIIYLLTVKEIKSFKKDKFIHKKYNH